MSGERGTGAPPRSDWMPTIYFVVGQVGWFACVLGAAHGAPWIGVATALVLVGFHLGRVVRPVEELKFVTLVVVLGGAWDTLLVNLRLLAYPAHLPHLAPFWIMALWAVFAAQFNTTYRWLKPHIALAGLLGAVAGPLSFHAGAALGALRFVEPWPAAAALAAGWAVLLPVLILLSRRWDGVRASVPVTAALPGAPP